MREEPTSLDRRLDLAVALVEKGGLVEGLPQGRLTPDPRALAARVRVTHDDAKGAVTRLAIKPVPSHRAPRRPCPS